MKIIANGEPMDVGEGSRLSDIVKAMPYQKGALIAVTKGISSIKKRTNE